MYVDDMGFMVCTPGTTGTEGIAGTEVIIVVDGVVDVDVFPFVELRSG